MYQTVQIILALLAVLVVTTLATATNNSTFEKLKCLKNSEEFEYCDKQLERCVRESIEEKNCGDEKCSCMKEIGVDDHDCKHYVQNECEKSKKFHPGAIVTEQTVIDIFDEKVMKSIRFALEASKTTCFNKDYSERLNELKSTFTKRNDFVWEKILPAMMYDSVIRTSVKSEACEEDVYQLEKLLIVLEKKNYQMIHIPFADYYCGNHLGDFPKIFLRATSAFVSPQTASEFNHCCAVHLDCSEVDHTDCQKRFETCTQKVVDSLGGRKSSAIQFKNILDILMKLELPHPYEKMRKTETTYMAYSDISKREFQGFKNRKTGSEKSIIYLLMPDDSFGERFEKAAGLAYKYCHNESYIISSCISQFTICKTRFSTDKDCLLILRDCLLEAEHQSERCKAAIREFKNSPESGATPWWKPDNLSTIAMEILVIPVLWVIGKGCKACYERMKRDHRILERV